MCGAVFKPNTARIIYGVKIKATLYAFVRLHSPQQNVSAGEQVYSTACTMAGYNVFQQDMGAAWKNADREIYAEASVHFQIPQRNILASKRQHIHLIADIRPVAALQNDFGIVYALDGDILNDNSAIRAAHRLGVNRAADRDRASARGQDRFLQRAGEGLAILTYRPVSPAAQEETGTIDTKNSAINRNTKIRLPPFRIKPPLSVSNIRSRP